MPEHSDETSLPWLLRRWKKVGGVGIVPDAAWVNLPQAGERLAQPSDGATATGLDRASHRRSSIAGAGERSTSAHENP